MPTPLRDQNNELVGWIHDENIIRNENNDLVARIVNNHIFAWESGDWLGPFHCGNCLDTSGHVVAWTPGLTVEGTARQARPARPARWARPARPARPVRPVRPVRPLRPTYGWSSLSWEEWINQI